ncbi:MAG: hypothetical protein H0W39_01175 [Sphingomonas sp.]|nr:hypothetical protein [Sphingomonas sp.]
MMRNPIYQALLSAGYIRRFSDHCKRQGELTTFDVQLRSDRKALRGLWLRQILTYDEYSAALTRLVRPFHAKILKLLRRELGLTGTRKMVHSVRHLSRRVAA